jgi:hypothetical protein
MLSSSSYGARNGTAVCPWSSEYFQSFANQLFGPISKKKRRSDSQDGMRDSNVHQELLIHFGYTFLLCARRRGINL